MNEQLSSFTFPPSVMLCCKSLDVEALKVHAYTKATLNSNTVHDWSLVVDSGCVSIH